VRKRLSLTEIGQLYANQVRLSLDKMERYTMAAMAHRNAGGVLEIATIPTFATRWLIPRLSKFYADNREVTINLTTRAQPFLFTDTPFDAAIHFGDPVWPGSIAKHLFGEEMTVVCSPRLLCQEKELDLQRVRDFLLLHQTARPEAWRLWLTEAGLHDLDAVSGQRYELFSMLVEAAKAGLGIALVPRFLILEELSSGVLATPFKLSLNSAEGYYLVHPECKQNSPTLQRFESWLLTEAKRYVACELQRVSSPRGESEVA